MRSPTKSSTIVTWGPCQWGNRRGGYGKGGGATCGACIVRCPGRRQEGGQQKGEVVQRKRGEAQGMLRRRVLQRWAQGAHGQRVHETSADCLS